ncbi:exportin-4 isoform X1 [Asparagus officinalis]|uniref:exportin-4 isoform X1 n=1 Tax=Asparagus officinalis TaxID=4686 RepID=UPI00098E3C8F|nr:exportin-4 isoform X1 [Asparagus officinalis]
MDAFPGGPVDSAQLQSTMITIEHACSSIQMHMNPAESEKLLILLRQSPMPYKSCRFILENSQVPTARFQAASAIRDAAIREWGVLTEENRRSLILFCLCYVMERANTTDAYVQSKVSAVAAQLLKRGWLDFDDAKKAAIFSEVKQAVLGIHGTGPQFAGISFLESLVSEFSPTTSTAMGLPKEFHGQCQSLLESNYLKEFYCWAQNAALSVTDKILRDSPTVSEDKVCSAALRLMFQILNWNFKQTSYDPSGGKIYSCSSGISYEASLLKKFERCLVQPGPTWRDALLSSGHIVWLLNLYAALRQKYSSDVIWVDSPLAVSARQLIVQFCSLSGAIFPSDNGEMQIKHLLQILSSVIHWIEPVDAVIEAIISGRSESELVDGCHVLLSIATLTRAFLFDNLLRSLRSYGTLHLLSIMTCEVVKADVARSSEEETWTAEALDILLETWSVILGRPDTDKNSISAEGVTSAATLFNSTVESLLHAAAESAFDDENESEHFVASISKRDERLGSYALIARAASEITIPFLTRLFADRFSLLNQNNGRSDPTHTLEELYWLLLITAHVLSDSSEGETVLIPQALEDAFPNVLEENQHPVVIISWSIIDFSRWCLDQNMRTTYFSPRLMEAVIWFFARWVDTYVMPLGAKGHSNTAFAENGQDGSQISKKILHSFAGEHNQGGVVLDVIVRICMVSLTSYPGENDLQALTCQKLLKALVRRKHVCSHLVSLDAWHDLAKVFSTERILLPVNACLQRSLAEALVCAAIGLKDPEASNQYVRDLMGPTTAYLVEVASRNDLVGVAQQADAIHMISCMLERLRGAARATQPRYQKGIFEMGHAVMNPLLTLLEAYKNQPAVVYLILKFVADLVYAQVTFLNAQETSILVTFCLQLLQIYSKHNIGKISLSLSISLQSEAQAEKYRDLRALLQLLTNIASKDLVDFSLGPEEVDIAQVIYIGLHTVSPLISLELLRYPKLSRDYFTLVSHMLEVYPEKVAQLSKEAFLQIIATLDFGIQHQDIDVVDMCLRAVNALASYHYKERVAGKGGLGAHAIVSQGSNGKLQESIVSHFLRLLLQLLLFEDFRMELAGSAADTLLALVLCEQELYQRLVQEFLERQPNPTLQTRLTRALHSLTSSNQLSSSLDRPNRNRFRKNFHVFLTDISGLRLK